MIWIAIRTFYYVSKKKQGIIDLCLNAAKTF